MVGFARASDIILSGRKVSAVEALEIGLANEIAPAEGLIERSLELARRVAALPAFTMRMAKRALAVGQDEARMQAVREFGSLANRMGQVDGAAGPASPE
jgi:enoyl-CoA hydratase/carnithine racemase